MQINNFIWCQRKPGKAALPIGATDCRLHAFFSCKSATTQHHRQHSRVVRLLVALREPLRAGCS